MVDTNLENSPGYQNQLDAMKSGMGLNPKPTGPTPLKYGQTYVNDPQFTNQAQPGGNEVSYRDEFGRTASGVQGADGKISRGPTVTFDQGNFPGSKPKPVTSSNINPTNPTVTTPPTNTRPEESDPKIAGIKLSTVQTLLQAGVTANAAYGLATNGFSNAGTLFPWLNNSIDNLGSSTGLFTNTANAVYDASGNMISPSTYIDSFGTEVQGASSLVNTGGQIPLSNAVGWGMVGGSVAQLVGLGARGMLLNTGASVAGGALGGAVGGAIGGDVALGSVTIAAGTIGAFVGGFALVALAGMLQGKPSAKMAWGSYDPNSGDFKQEWDPAKYSPENKEYNQKYYDVIKSLQGDMVKNYGGDFSGMGQINAGTGNRAGKAELEVSIGDRTVPGGITNTRSFGEDTAGSIEWIGKESVRLMGNLKGDVAVAQKNIDYNQPLSAVLGDMNFARDFNKVSQAMITGTMVLDLTKDQATASVNAWAERAKKLGLDQKTINQAVQTATANINAKTT